MIVWGGTSTEHALNTGGKYSPSTDEWHPVTPNRAPEARFGHTAIWTGSQMIVWGGYREDGTLATDGSAYDPSTDVWTSLPTGIQPEGMVLHTAIWTGSEMIIWGGSNGLALLNTGRKLRPN
jgi:N-acetylneuraminic acid mutarotase